MKSIAPIAAAVVAASVCITVALTLFLIGPAHAVTAKSTFVPEVAVLFADYDTATTDAVVALDEAIDEATATTIVVASETDEAADGSEAAAADSTESAEATAEATETEAEAAANAASANQVALSIPVTGASDTRNSVPIMDAGTLNVGGHIISYIDYFGEASAPTSGAGLWLGDDSTQDGSWGYFIGHNPGDFSGVMDLTEGNAVTVCDNDGKYRTYYVVDDFTVSDDTYWEDIESRVTGYGESIILQTCVGDHEHYRVVVAA